MLFGRVFDRGCLSLVRSIQRFLMFGRVVDRSVVGRKFDNFLKCFIVCSTVVVSWFSSSISFRCWPS